MGTPKDLIGIIQAPGHKRDELTTVFIDKQPKSAAEVIGRAFNSNIRSIDDAQNAILNSFVNRILEKYEAAADSTEEKPRLNFKETSQLRTDIKSIAPNLDPAKLLNQQNLKEQKEEKPYNTISKSHLKKVLTGMFEEIKDDPTALKKAVDVLFKKPEDKKEKATGVSPTSLSKPQQNSAKTP